MGSERWGAAMARPRKLPKVDVWLKMREAAELMGVSLRVARKRLKERDAALGGSLLRRTTDTPNGHFLVSASALLKEFRVEDNADALAEMEEFLQKTYWLTKINRKAIKRLRQDLDRVEKWIKKVTISAHQRPPSRDHL